MGAELGATTSIFPSDEATRAFLEAQGFEFDPASANVKDGALKAIYLKDEIAGFAIHLVQK